MKFKSTLLAVGLLVPSFGFAGNYFIRSAAQGSGDGSSWDDALAFETFYTNFQGGQYADGDKFYFAEGSYTVPSTTIGANANKGFTLMGGYSTSLTGTEIPTVDYSAHRTTISGDINGDGERNAGDAGCLFAFNAATTNKAGIRPITIQGFDFCGVYNTASNNSNSDKKGALHFDNCGDVYVKNCNFYNNELTADGGASGGAALLNYRSTVYCTDCQFTANKGAARGGAIRVTSNSNAKGYLTLERCLLANNEVTKGTGAALCVQSAAGITLINTTVTGNKSGSQGCLFFNGANSNYPNEIITIVSSTITNNDCEEEIRFNGSPKLNIANSIVAPQDGKTAIRLGTASTDTYFSVVSGGYNLIGAYTNTVETDNTFPAAETDKQSDEVNYAAIFGTNTLTEAGVVYPTTTVKGATNEQLASAVAAWSLSDANLAVDQLGATRDGSVPGAVNKPESTGVEKEIVDQPADNAYYTLTGVRVEKLTKGIYITNGKKVIFK